MKAGRLILSAIIAAGCIFSAVGCSGEKSSVGNVEEMNFVDGDVLAEITIEGYGTIKAKLFPDLCPDAVENFRLLAESGYYNGLKIHRVLEDTVIQGGSLLGDGTGEKALINDDGEFEIESDPRARHFYGALCYANEYGKNATQFFIVNNKQSQDLSKYDPEQIKVAAAAYGELASAAESGSPDYELNTYKQSYYTRLAEMISEKDTDAAALYSKQGGLPLFDGGYTVFGQVYEGFEVMEAISSVEVMNNAQGEKSKPVEDIIISSVVIVDYKAPTTAETGDNADADDKESAEVPKTAEAATSEAMTTEAESSDISIETIETVAAQTAE